MVCRMPPMVKWKCDSACSPSLQHLLNSPTLNSSSCGRFSGYRILKEGIFIFFKVFWTRSIRRSVPMKTTDVLLIHGLCSMRFSIVIVFMKYVQSNYLISLSFYIQSDKFLVQWRLQKNSRPGRGHHCAAFSLKTLKWSIHEVKTTKRSRPRLFKRWIALSTG